MRLSAKILKNVNNINSWKYANQAYMQEGQANELYIQLVDLDLSIAIDPEKSPAFTQYPIRYISNATTISISATFPALDDDEEFSVAGTQPFADDKSIWKFDLTSSQIPNSGYIKVSLTEDSVTRTFMLRNAVTTELLEIGGC